MGHRPPSQGLAAPPLPGGHVAATQNWDVPGFPSPWTVPICCQVFAAAFFLFLSFLRRLTSGPKQHLSWSSLSVTGPYKGHSLDWEEVSQGAPRAVGLHTLPLEGRPVRGVALAFDGAVTALTDGQRTALAAWELQGRPEALVLEEVQPVIGVRDFLLFVKESGLKTSVVSCYPSTVLSAALKSLLLDDVVDVVVSAEPDSMIGAACVSLALLPSEVVVVIGGGPETSTAKASGLAALVELSAAPSSSPDCVTAPHYIGLLPYWPGALPSLSPDVPTCWFAAVDVFSNFSPHPVYVDGLLWPTSEHFYQSCKFHGQPGLQELVRCQPSPAAAAKVGRDPQNALALTPDWADRKKSAMAAALLAKFTQRAECRRPLLASGAALLAEYSEKDPYWGRGRRSGGANYLGRLLMAVRDLLRQQPADYVWDGSTQDVRVLVDTVWGAGTPVPPLHVHP
eukprot:EG_transcript_9884